MASSPDNLEGVVTPLPHQPKLPVVPLLIGVVLAILLSLTLLASGGYYMLKSGRVALPIVSGAVPSIKSELAAPTSTHSVALEPMVVNLADDGGRAYLRLGLTLRVEDPEPRKDDKSREDRSKNVKGTSEVEAAVRDTALEVLGRQTSERLLAAQGKVHLKSELRSALAERNPELKVADVYFTEFLVQR